MLGSHTQNVPYLTFQSHGLTPIRDWSFSPAWGGGGGIFPTVGQKAHDPPSGETEKPGDLSPFSKRGWPPPISLKTKMKILKCFCVCGVYVCTYCIHVVTELDWLMALLKFWRMLTGSLDFRLAHPSWTGLSCMSGWERGLSTRMTIVWFALSVSSLCYICVTEQFFLVTRAIVDLCEALILSFEIFWGLFLPFLGLFYDPVLVFVEYSTCVVGTLGSVGQMHACGLVGESAILRKYYSICCA